MTLSNKKTIVYVLPTGGIGGTEQYIYNFFANFQSNVYRANVLFLFSGGKIANEIKLSGIETTILGIKNGFDLFGFIRFYHYIRKTKPTILHFHGTCITARLTALFFPSIIKINTDHGPSYHSYFYRKKRQALVGKLLTLFTDHYIAISKVMVKTLIQYSGVNKDKVTLIYNGIPLHHTKSLSMNNLKKSLKIPKGKKILLTVGRLSRQKRVDFLIDAFSKIIRKNPSCCLLLLGDGPERDILLNQSRKLKLEDSVFFLGFRRDVSDILMIADVYVCSSEWEAFSISILEVMLAQKPIVAFNVDGINEAVIDGMNGYLVSFGDTESFADRILQLLNDNNLAKKMGQSGYQRVLPEFSIEKNISKTLSLYERILTARGIK